MKKDNLHEKNIPKNCDICGKPILIDKYRFGSCKNCGWQNDEAAVDNPDYPNLSNFVSLNNAKSLYNEKKPIVPNFDEFMEMIRVYGEMEFIYKNKVYGIIRDDKITMFCVGIDNSTKTYQTYEDFKEKANIDGNLL